MTVNESQAASLYRPRYLFSKLKVMSMTSIDDVARSLEFTTTFLESHGGQLVTQAEVNMMWIK